MFSGRFFGPQVWRILISIMRQDSALFVMNLKFHSICLAFRSRAMRMGRLPHKQAYRSEAIRGREVDRHTARIYTGLLANMTWIAVPSRCLDLGWVQRGDVYREEPV